jgi:hypothetical protein
MHGHPFAGPMLLWWGRSDQLDPPRNLFYAQGKKPRPEDMFQAGGRISPAACVDRTGLHLLIGKLDNRTRGLPASDPNRSIPSGYTYLLQFIAHDMVDSVTSISTHGSDIWLDTKSARSAPLLLETLYGSGPEENPQAYEFTARQEKRGLIPRTRLRVGPRARQSRGVEIPPGQNPYCPFRDIARNPSQSIPSASPPGGAGGAEPRTLLTEVMLADPRNDAHALISQLTILFQLLHNHVLSLVEGATADIETSGRYPPGELAYRQFHCARTIVTLIYRNIVEKDVLRHILAKDVYRRYVLDGMAPLDPRGSIPVEFTFGAFRFGHAMVRDIYQINSEFSEQPMSAALDLSALMAHRELLPVKEDWCVDWARFFENDRGITPNFSSLLQPRYPKVLTNRSFLWPPRTPGVDVSGLLYRDLLGSAFAGVLSVPALIKSARDRGFESVESFDAWKPRLRAWLGSGDIPPDDVEALACDPPLPFFVLFEATCISKSGELIGGKCLGPLGSIIVAEGICGAMRNHPLNIDGDSLKERIQNCGRLLFVITGPEHEPVQEAISMALSGIDEIETMTELLQYMARAEIFVLKNQRTANT